MAALWTSMVPEIVAASMARDRWASKVQRTQDFIRYQTFYEGGTEVAQYLTKHPGEENDEFADRKARFASLNFTRRVADEVRNAVYGGPVELEIPSASEQEMAVLEDVWAYNSMDTLRTVMGSSAAVNGGAWTNVAYVPRDENICLHVVPPQYMDYEVDPDNPWHLAAVDETRVQLTAQGTEKKTHWVWVAPGFAGDKYPKGWGLYLDDGGGILDERFVPNPYGVLPYVYLRGLPKAGVFEGLSYIRDVVTLQQAICDDLSDLRYTIQLQGYGIPWIDAPEPKTKEKPASLSPGRIAWLGEQGRSLNFANPSAPISEVLGAVERTIDWLFEVGCIPVGLARGTVAESGVALIIKFRPYTSLGRDLRLRAADAEIRLLKTICAIGRAEGMKLPDPEQMRGENTPRVKFLEDVMPADYAMERTQDQLDIEAGRMAPTDYLTRWRDGVDSEAQAREYLERIEEERALMRPQQQPPQPPPPGGSPLDLGGIFGGDEPEEAQP